MPGGRPSKFDQLTELDIANIERMAKRGFTDAEMSEFLDITEQTFNNWKVSHPEFFESLKSWKVFADERVERALYERACGYSHPEDKIFNNGNDKEPTVIPTIKHYAPDSTSMIFWLKNRQPDKWRDKQEIEHSGKIVTRTRKRFDGSSD